MTTRVYVKHPPYRDGHLAIVADEMNHAGAPTVPAVIFRGHLVALAGSHRLYEAWSRGIAPKLVILPADAESDLDEFFAAKLPTLPWYDFDQVLAIVPAGEQFGQPFGTAGL